jgi:glycosidase
MKITALLAISFLSIFALKAVAQGNPAEPAYKGPPAPEDAVIYEINLQHFSKEGTINGAIRGLDAVKELGANVIYLMPIYPVGEFKSFGSQYCIRDYTSVNKKLGSIEDLRTLVRTAHQKNIAVIIDWVANHTSFDNPWLANEDWYLRDNAGNAISPPGTGWKDVAQLNYKNKDMQAAMISAMQYWVINAGVDGFRCDYADGPPIDFWKRAISSTRKVAKRDLFFLAESGTADLYKAGFDLISGFDFYNSLKQVYRENKSAKAIEHQKNPGRRQDARYISNHDLVGSDGPLAKVFDNDRGAMAAFVVACIEGTPIIYNTQEGAPEKTKGVHAAEYTTEQISPEYKKILALRNNSDAIKRGRLTSYSNDDVYVVKKDYGAESVLVICNLRNRKLSYPLAGVLSSMQWEDALSQKKKQLSAAIEIEPFGYFILKAAR